MKKAIKSYGSTPSLRNLITQIKMHTQYVGKDENDEPIYDESISKMPIIDFVGTVKLHGTNTSVIVDAKHNVIAQGRNVLLEPGTTSNNFLGFVEEKEHIFSIMAVEVRLALGLPLSTQVIFYGEWAGKGIQKGTAINNFDKAFYIFAVRVKKPTSETWEWVDYLHEFGLKYLEQHNIFNITNFQTYPLRIDFNKPSAVVPQLERWIEDIEAECPVAAARGVIGLGEGIVFVSYNRNYIFKEKGEKHAMNQKKTKVEIAPEVTESKEKFAAYVVGDGRFNQALVETGATEMKHIGAMMKWVSADVIKEEQDSLKENGFEFKEVQREISNIVRSKYIAHLKQF